MGSIQADSEAGPRPTSTAHEALVGMIMIVAA